MKKYGFYKTVCAVSAGVTAACFAAVGILGAAAVHRAKTRASASDEVYDRSKDGEVLRLHVIANSDSERDQRIKLAVRDAVVEYEREKNGGQTNAGDAEKNVMEGGGELLETVRRVLRENGADYDAQIMLGSFPFPEREYSGKVYPAGEYRALRIVLGSGGGRNWWCILFPPLCLIDEGCSETTAPDEPLYPVRFKSLFVRLFDLIRGGAK